MNLNNMYSTIRKVVHRAQLLLNICSILFKTICYVALFLGHPVLGFFMASFALLWPKNGVDIQPFLWTGEARGSLEDLSSHKQLRTKRWLET